MDRLPLSPAELRYRQDFLTTFFRVAMVVSPLSMAGYLLMFLQTHNWAMLITAVISGGAVGLIRWGLWSVRRGNVLLPARLMLLVLLAIATFVSLFIPDVRRPVMAATFALVIVVATALELPGKAVRWAVTAIACYVASLLLPDFLHLPPEPERGTAQALTYLISTSILLLVWIVGRSTTSHLRTALEQSETARHNVEQANIGLERLTTSLERRNRELQSFAYVISHDLRTPLRALNNYSAFLQQDCADRLDENGLAYIHGIADSARHMDALVVALLEYSRIGREAARPEDVELGALLERVVTALNLRSHAEVTLPAHAPVLRVSPIRLEQILSKLLSNAVKFRRQDVRLEIAIECADRDGAWELSVRDNGIGIDPKHFERIFGIFQRLHLPNEYEGIGIGLAIAKKAVEEGGGKVWVESTPGEGSTFRFTVPKTPPAAVPQSGGLTAA